MISTLSGIHLQNYIIFLNPPYSDPKNFINLPPIPSIFPLQGAWGPLPADTAKPIHNTPLLPLQGAGGPLQPPPPCPFCP